MSATDSKTIKLVPAPLDLNHLGHFTERDVGQSVRIWIYPIHACPTDVPDYVESTGLLSPSLRSMRPQQRNSWTPYASRIVLMRRHSWSRHSRRSSTCARSCQTLEDHRAGLRDKDDLKVLQKKVQDEGRKRGPQVDRTGRFEAVPRAANGLREALSFLTDLDRLAIDEGTSFSRLRLDDISSLMTSMSEAFRLEGKPGAPYQRPHEHRFVDQLAMHFYIYVARPSRTGTSLTKGYAGPFEKYVRSVIEVAHDSGIVFEGDTKYLTESAADRLKLLVKEGQPHGTV